MSPPGGILIVEDEFLVALDAEDTLIKAGFSVVGIARTYEEAVEMTERLKPVLAIMDVRLASQRDGVEAAIEIRRRFGIGSIFASAHSDPYVRERAAPAQPLGWLAKPYPPFELVRFVSEVLGKPQT